MHLVQLLGELRQNSLAEVLKVIQLKITQSVIRSIMVQGKPVSHKTILLQLITRLTDGTDLQKQERLRVLLQQVVGSAPDDPGI